MHKLFQMLAAIVAAVTATFAPHSDVHPTSGVLLRHVVVAPPAPADLAEQVRQLGDGFNGHVGIAIHDIDAGWTAAWNGDQIFPQQSVAKLWVALTAFQQIDEGRQRLDDPVFLTRDDLSLFHQPLAAKVGANGYTATVDELLYDALAKSDNAANDALIRRSGGPDAVRTVVLQKGLGAIRAGEEERILEPRIAGMEWRPEYTQGWAFQNARELLPADYRKAKLDEYVADPADGASPDAIVLSLARLKKGELLSPASTQHFLDILSQTETGARRLKGGLPDGWTIQHKTGTGQELGARQTGWNDVGIVTAPDGHAYAVAVMIGDTTASLGERIALFQKVARALAEWHARNLPAQQQAQAQPKAAA
ncbi:MAG: serine hydrolase [Parcubacteria group bacterium]